MRFFALVVALFMLLTPFSAVAQDPMPFSDPPAGAPDFPSWDATRNFRRSIDISSPDAGPVEQAVVRGGLCRADALPCTVYVRVAFSFLDRCIAQNDQEFDCRQRMAWKKVETLIAVGQYTMESGDMRIEGFVLETKVPPKERYFIRTAKPAEWNELSGEPEREQQDLFTALYRLAIRRH